MARAKIIPDERDQEIMRLRAAISKVIGWLDRLADQSSKQAEDKRFLSLSEACAADAKNYRATADSLRRVLSGP